MTDPDAPVRRLICAVDVHAYSGRRAYHQVDVQRTLLEALDGAAERTGLDRAGWYKQPQGDAEVAVLPADAPEAIVVADFVRELGNRLARVNHAPDPSSRLRLRVAVHSGLVHFGHNGLPGPGAVETCRLLDSPALKEALAKSDADLALVVSAGLFHDIVRPGYRGLRAADFTEVQVTVKEFSGTGYVRLIGGPGADAAPPLPGPEQSAGKVAPSGPGTTSGLPSQVGVWSSGSGDAVGRDKHVHGDRHGR